MCGIAGFIGSYEAELLGAMGAALAHRGPDGSGEWFDSVDGVGFAHRRLAIIDLSERGHQPMWDAHRRAVIIYNGEIYNYRELRRELVTDGFTFRSECDTEVVLNLYLRDGPAFLEKLNGIFALAIWDTRNKEMLLARDPLGVKPLYLARTKRGMIFASEIKALLRASDLDRSIDHASLVSHLTFLYSPSPHTMLRAVRKLAPGSALSITADGQTRRAWQFYELPYGQPIASISVRDAIEQTRVHLREAVRRQMVADVPVGAFLSGGLDSGSVVAFAREFAGKERLRCFTIGNKGVPESSLGATDDLPYARTLAKHLGVDLTTVWVGSDMTHDLEEMVYQLDEPQADPAALNALYICRLARENGLKVLLSGAGGDDVFTGYRRHLALSLERYWSWMPVYLRDVLRGLADRFPKDNLRGRRFAKAFQYAELSGDARVASYFQWIKPEELRPLFSRRSLETVNVDAGSQLMVRALANLPDRIPPINRMLFLDTKYFLADHNLNYTDKMSMAAGVEVRVPLLDLDLVSFAARLPVNLKQRGKEGKWILKKAMESMLPKNVIYRKKVGFGVPLHDWLKRKPGSLLGDYLSEESITRRGIFDAQGVRNLIANHEAGRIDAAYVILALACIEIWLRKFVD